MSAWESSGAPVVRWECPCGSVIESRGKMLLAWAITDHETRDHAAGGGKGE